MALKAVRGTKDIFGKDFLHDYDPMFKKVLEIEKKN